MERGERRSRSVGREVRYTERTRSKLKSDEVQVLRLKTNLRGLQNKAENKKMNWGQIM